MNANIISLSAAAVVAAVLIAPAEYRTPHTELAHAVAAPSAEVRAGDRGDALIQLANGAKLGDKSLEGKAGGRNGIGGRNGVKQKR
jgi:hypothetical protein